MLPTRARRDAVVSYDCRTMRPSFALPLPAAFTDAHSSMADAGEEELVDYEEEAEEVAPAAGDAKAAAPKKGYVGIHATGFKDFLLKPEILRAIVDCGFEHPSEGATRADAAPRAVGLPWLRPLPRAIRVAPDTARPRAARCRYTPASARAARVLLSRRSPRALGGTNAGVGRWLSPTASPLAWCPSRRLPAAPSPAAP